MTEEKKHIGVRLIGGGKGKKNEVTAESQRSGYVDPEQVEAFLLTAGALQPPYNMDILTNWLQYSPSLQRNIAALCANVDGYGYRLKPRFDPDAEDAFDRVKEAIKIGRYSEGDPVSALSTNSIVVVEPTDAEVTAKLELLRQRSIREKFALEMWIDGLAYDGTLTDLRKRMRTDMELTGNGYWEVLRSRASGKPVKLRCLPSRYMRLCVQIDGDAEVQEMVRTSPVDWSVTTVRRRFRRFVEWLGDGTVVYFKEFGDPRIVSRKCGRVFADMESFNAWRDSDDTPATEIVHWSIWFPGLVYGVPRWVGTTPFIVGERDAADVNAGFIKNKSVPPMAVLVSGGTLGDDSIGRLERAFKRVKGKEHFHDIIVLEAKPHIGSDGQPAKTTIELKPLTEALQKDAGFLLWDTRCQEQVGGAFRIPPILRGETKDFNRATAEAALEFAEQQVFQAERKSFDDWMNRYMVVGQLGVLLWEFESLGPTTQDSETLAGIVERLCRVGVLTPREGRDVVEGAIGTKLQKLEGDWPDLPLSMTLAGFSPPKNPEEEDDESSLDFAGAAAQAARDALARDAAERQRQEEETREHGQLQDQETTNKG